MLHFATQVHEIKTTYHRKQKGHMKYVFACSLVPGPLLHVLKTSCYRLGMPPRKIILVIYSTFLRELFHHIKNVAPVVLHDLNTKLNELEREPM